jgi:hypothetical protein
MLREGLDVAWGTACVGKMEQLEFGSPDYGTCIPTWDNGSRVALLQGRVSVLQILWWDDCEQGDDGGGRKNGLPLLGA